jgi:hypothetical protein
MEEWAAAQMISILVGLAMPCGLRQTAFRPPVNLASHQVSQRHNPF